VLALENAFGLNDSVSSPEEVHHIVAFHERALNFTLASVFEQSVEAGARHALECAANLA